MLLRIKKTPPLLAFLVIGAAIEILCALPMPTYASMGPRAQITASLFLGVAIIVWLIFGSRQPQEKPEKETVAD